MDEIIAKWIIEFLLRQKIDDKIINGIISSFPVVNNDFRLKKTMLLRRIETEMNNGCISEIILELIELIEALDYDFGNLPSDLMKEAYCLSAVDCTVRFLGENVEENAKFIEMIEIIWKSRVCKSEALFSEVSRRWFDDIVAAVSYSSVREMLWMRNTRNEALKAVKAFLKEAWDGLGPSFIELAVRKTGNDIEAVCHTGGGVCLGTQKGPPLTRRKHVAVKGRRQRGAKISDTDEVAKEAGDGIKETVRADDPIPEVSRGKEAISSSPTKLPAVGDHPSGTLGKTPQTISSPKSTGNKNVVETPEAVRVQRNLRSSTKALHAAVTDPLPEALKKAQTLTSSIETNNLESVVRSKTRSGAPITPVADKAREMAKKTVSNVEKNGLSKQAGTKVDASKQTNGNGPENVKQQTVNEDARGPIPSTIPETEKVRELAKNTVTNAEKDAGALKPKNSEKENSSKRSNENDPEKVKQDAQGRVTQDAGVPINTRKRSLMEPDGTSHTFEWDDDIENSSGSPARPRLPSPKVQRTSPLKVPEYRNFRRRERKRWTPLEEDTLREGVLKYGRGNWKLILNDAKFAGVFQCRTDVDLKDKWRNLTKYS